MPVDLIKPRDKAWKIEIIKSIARMRGKEKETKQEKVEEKEKDDNRRAITLTMIFDARATYQECHF